MLLNGDRLEFAHDQAMIARMAEAMQPNWPEAPEGVEDYGAWWEAAEAEPAFAQAVAERRSRHVDHPHDNPGHTYAFYRAALLAAGFTEVGTIWQRVVNRVLVAVR